MCLNNHFNFFHENFLLLEWGKKFCFIFELCLFFLTWKWDASTASEISAWVEQLTRKISSLLQFASRFLHWRFPSRFSLPVLYFSWESPPSRVALYLSSERNPLCILPKKLLPLPFLCLKEAVVKKTINAKTPCARLPISIQRNSNCLLLLWRKELSTCCWREKKNEISMHETHCVAKLKCIVHAIDKTPEPRRGCNIIKD